jgi:ribosomal protein S18 acetylase RimI-like enzyme
MADLETILNVLQAWPTHFVERAATEVRRTFDPESTLVAERAGILTGFLMWQADPTGCQVTWMAVLPSLARRRVGTTLMNEFLREVTIRPVTLRTATLDSQIPGTAFTGPAFAGTRSFFKSLGFIETRVDHEYWGPTNHSLVMTYLEPDPR